MQIPLLAGRTFNTQDTSTSRHVAIISERMAKDLFPAAINPIGHHYYTGFDPIPDNDVEVIGILKDVKFGNFPHARCIADSSANLDYAIGARYHLSGRQDSPLIVIRQQAHPDLLKNQQCISHAGSFRT